MNIILLFTTVTTLGLQTEPASTDSVQARIAYPVVVGTDTVTVIREPLGAFTPAQRASAASERLTRLVQSRSLDSTKVQVVDRNNLAEIRWNDEVLLVISDADAGDVGREVRAHEIAGRMAAILIPQGEAYSRKALLIDLAIAAGMAIALGLFLLVFRWIFPRIYDRIERLEGTVLRAVSVRSTEIISAGSLVNAVLALAKGVRLALSLALLYIFLTRTLAMFPWTQTWNLEPIIRGLFETVAVTAAAFVLGRTILAIHHRLSEKVRSWKGTLIKPVRLRSVEVFSEERITDLILFGGKISRVVLFLILGYFYVTLVFSFFVFTETWAASLVGYVLQPLMSTLRAFIVYIPNMVAIVVVATITRYFIRFIHFLFNEVGKGSITLPGFYREWAEPTFKIVRFLILAFAAVVIFPYLPGADSPFFQGISVFLGVLFSLGSTSAVANIVAGTVLTYMRPFRVGDRVRIADTVGDVVEKSLLVTRVRTIKNVDVTIPNSMVLGAHIVNYSSSSEERGLILHTAVTIGYDVPWQKVHALLVEAAGRTAAIEKQPAPFVLQTDLGDHSVRYELNGTTRQPARMAMTYSELHQNIQDVFNGAGVEILSPQYTAVRDGNTTTIPAEHLPPDYAAPGFRIDPLSFPPEAKGKGRRTKGVR